MTVTPYVEKRRPVSRFIPVRGLRYHVLQWGDARLVTPERPALVMVHGWMDVAASFQFAVDALAQERCICALDWRGFGLTESPPTDAYWFPDYLGDLDAALDVLAPGCAVDLLGHSLGGNVVMSYAGVRPQRVRRLINLEGFGMPPTVPAQAPGRLARWLDELKAPAELRSYDSVGDVAARLRKTNPLLRPERAAWLAPHWSRQREDGRWHLLADAAHKRINPVLYRGDEILDTWRRIEAPVLWVEGDQTRLFEMWKAVDARAEVAARRAVVARLEKHVLAPAGHMLHHDQPEALAGLVERFLA